MNVLRWDDYQRIAKAFARGQYSDSEDFIQDIIIELEKEDREKNYAATRDELLRAARRVKARLYRARKYDSKLVHNQNDENDESDESDTPNFELVTGMYTADFAEKIDAKLDTKAIIEKLPERLREIGQRRVDKYTLTDDERAYLFRQRKKLRTNTKNRSP
jgi:hypothetical protein